MTDPEDHTAANRATYDRIAPLYLARQLQDHAGSGDLFRQLERHWCANLPGGARVADLGCGPALDAERFARAGYRVVGVDLSAGMLRMAARRLPGRLAQAELRALPLREPALDGIWCAAALLHVPDAATAVVLSGFRRLLRPGGALALVTAIGEGSRFEAVPYAQGEHRWFVYRSRDQLKGQMQDVGFRIAYAEVVDGSRRWLTAVALAEN